MTTDFLKIIVEDKKQEVAAAKKNLSEKQLREIALLPREKRPFLKNLESPGPSDVNIIAETQIENPSEMSPEYVPLTVATVCMSAQADKAANLATFAKYIEAAAERSVNLIVFPEISLQQNPGWGRNSYKPTQEESAYVRKTAEPALVEWHRRSRRSSTRFQLGTGWRRIPHGRRQLAVTEGDT